MLLPIVAHGHTGILSGLRETEITEDKMSLTSSSFSAFLSLLKHVQKRIP